MARGHHRSVVDIAVELQDIRRTVWEVDIVPSPCLDSEPQFSSHNSMERCPDGHSLLLSTSLRN